jgi:hypothetical protein
MMGGDIPNLDPPSLDDEVHPLSGSCAKCNLDETGHPDFAISRCGKCKLTRHVHRILSFTLPVSNQLIVLRYCR